MKLFATMRNLHREFKRKISTYHKLDTVSDSVTLPIHTPDVFHVQCKEPIRVYTFSGEDNPVASYLQQGSDEVIIYNLDRILKEDMDEEAVINFLVHVELHELTHWAVEDYSCIDDNHTSEWADPLNDIVMYTTETRYYVNVED